MKRIRWAIIGATGLVGRTTLDVLTEWQVPIAELRLFASDGSHGRVMEFRGRQIQLEKLDHVPGAIDTAIFATSRAVSRQWIPQFREREIIVIDHSSEFRMDSDVPLVIPEVNGDMIGQHRNLIANPNCSASVVVIPLAAIDHAAGLKTVIVDTYQSVSGSGQDAVAELEAELHNPDTIPRIYPKQIAHNVFPQVGPFDDYGLCDEEQKIIQELQKILRRPELRVFATTVRVPVRVGHSAAVTVECERPIARPELENAFTRMSGLIYDADSYRTPLEIAGKQEIFVGRLRQDRNNPRWIQFWTVGDNLRKGAASNAVQIVMELFKN